MCETIFGIYRISGFKSDKLSSKRLFNFLTSYQQQPPSPTHINIAFIVKWACCLTVPHLLTSSVQSQLSYEKEQVLAFDLIPPINTTTITWTFICFSSAHWSNLSMWGNFLIVLLWNLNLTFVYNTNSQQSKLYVNF